MDSFNEDRKHSSLGTTLHMHTLLSSLTADDMAGYTTRLAAQRFRTEKKHSIEFIRQAAKNTAHSLTTGSSSNYATLAGGTAYCSKQAY
jgi:hypothetical protein